MKIFHKEYTRQLTTSLIILFFSLWANLISIQYVNTLSYRELPHDLLHELITYHQYYSVITDVLLAVIFFMFAGYVISKRLYAEVPFFLTCIGIFYMVRAIILPLTPLENPFPSSDSFGLFGNTIANGGTFPSGHTGLAFMLFFLIKPEDKVFRNTIFALCLIMAFFMIISRGHYTIDIIGGFLVAYFVHDILLRYKDNLFGKKIRI
jgi:membrane-associated phospholipid phosphatase